MDYDQLPAEELLKSIIRDALTYHITHEVTDEWILNAREYSPPQYLNTVD